MAALRGKGYTDIEQKREKINSDLTKSHIWVLYVLYKQIILPYISL